MKRPERFRSFTPPPALIELDEVWAWNEAHYGREHAAKYVAFLDRHIEQLAANPQLGRIVPARPDLHYLPITLTQPGDGHVVVYSADEQLINILHIFHTAQDRETKADK